MRKKMRTFVAAVAVAAVTAIVAACGGGAGGGSGAAAPSAAAAFPVTITHKLGTTTIPAQPTRIVALSFEEDNLAALGITPIAYGQNAYLPDGRFPWLAGKIDLSGSTALPDVFTALNIEQIAALKPDLILATNYYGLDQYYDKLARIAPTVGFIEEAGLSKWQDVSRLIGKAVGRSEQIEQAVARTEATVAAVRDELPDLRGKTFSSSFYYAEGEPLAVIDDPATTSVALYSDLGLRLSPAIVARVVDRSLSRENLGALDADYVSIGFETSQLKDELAADPLYRGLPSVAAGRVFEADGFAASTFNNPTLLNIPWQLEQIKPTLAKVAAG